jgi:hypothetical protein
MKTLTAVMIGFIVTATVVTGSQRDSVVGEWSTGEVLSQLGPSVTSYTFATNGSFTVATKFTQGQIPTMSASGVYHATTNAIIMITNSHTNTVYYRFEGSTLVIDEGRPSKVFRLTKKK